MYNMCAYGDDVSELLMPSARDATWPSHPHRLAALPYGGGSGGTAVFEGSFQRIALFGGVYNNYWALRAMIDDASSRGAELTLCLGDLGGFGPLPQRIVPLLQEAEIPTLAGNYDISVAEGFPDCGCGYSDPMDNYFAQISYSYTLDNTPTEQRRWLGSLPHQARIRLGDRWVHCCHGSPRRTNEFLWKSGTSEALLQRFLTDCDADVLACTHTGIKWHRRVNAGPRPGDVVNVGVIGRPENDGSAGVWYALLTAGDELEVEFIPLAYDHERLAEEMRQERLPEEFVETVTSGWWTTCLEVLPSKERLRGMY